MDVERALEKAEGCRIGVLLWLLWEGALKGSPPREGPRNSPCRDLEIQAGSYRSRLGAPWVQSLGASER